MKIIGQTKNGYLLEADANEIAKLVGYHYESSMRTPPERSYRDHTKIAIGDQINVAAMFGHLWSLEQAGKEIAAVVAKLRTAADLLETLPDPVTEVKVQPDPSPATQS